LGYIEKNKTGERMEKVLEEKIRDYIEKKIKPFIQRDGGDIELVRVSEDGIVEVRLKGQCTYCPSAGYTLKVGIEDTIKSEFPEVKSVRTVE
jgi:Fe-S cluster biogenesis protein NfuA